jgi:hypothetical protein
MSDHEKPTTLQDLIDDYLENGVCRGYNYNEPGNRLISAWHKLHATQSIDRILCADGRIFEVLPSESLSGPSELIRFVDCVDAADIPIP